MNGIVVRFGLKDCLETWGLQMVNDGYLVGLYGNNVTPTADTKLSDLNELAFLGYKRQLLTEFITPVWDSTAKRYTMQFVGVLFEGTDVAPVNAYGYFVVNPDNLLVAAQRFDTPPVPVGDPTSPIVIIPSISDINE